MNKIEYLYLGLTIAWLGIFAYITYLHKLLGKLKKDLKTIEIMVKDNEKKE